MATINVKTGNLRDNSGKLSNLGSKLRNIESRFTSIHHSLDYDVRRRDGIDRAMSNIGTQLDSISGGLKSIGVYLQNAATNYQKAEDRIKEKSNSLTKTVMFSISDISRGIARFIPSKVIKVLTSIGIFTKGSKLVTDTTGVKDFLKKSNVIVTNKRVFESIAGPVSKAAKVASDIAATNLAALIAKWEGIFKKPKINNVPTPSPAAQKPIVTDQAKFSRYLSYNPGVDDKDVRKLQQRLIDLGYGPLDPDGKYGDKTTAAVNRFKDANKLGNSGDWKGVVGPDTWACMFGAGAISASMIVEKDITDSSTSKVQNADGVIDYVYMSQEDPRWSGLVYSNHNDKSQTIGTSACGPTSMAMVIASLTGKEVTPPQLCDYAVKNGFRTYNDGTSWAFFNSAAKNNGLKCVQTANINDVKAALSDGKHMVIASMQPGHFTGGGHFVVLNGLENRDNKNLISVLDPNIDNRSYGTDGSIIQGEKNDGKVFATESVIKSEAAQYWIFEV